MARLPDPPQRGRSVLAWAQQVTDYLRSTTARGPGWRTGAGGSSYTRPIPDEIPPWSASEEATERPFQLFATATPGPTPLPRIGVVPSTLAGDLPSGMAPDDPPFLLIPQNGPQLIYGRITIVEATGDVVEREILQAEEVPEDTETLFHVLIGHYTFESPPGGGPDQIIDFGNYRYGPIAFFLCGESPVFY